MSKQIKVDHHAKVEIVDYAAEFSNAIPFGETLLSESVTHIAPDGTTATITSQIVGTQVQFALGPLTQLGAHTVDVDGTMTNGAIETIRLIIPCEW